MPLPSPWHTRSQQLTPALPRQPVIRDQMDITTDGFGFMLAFGDLVWVPFTYGLQARYLAFHPVKLGAAGTLAIALVSAVGAYIFRVSNSEKSDFRAGKNPKSASVGAGRGGSGVQGADARVCPREQTSPTWRRRAGPSCSPRGGGAARGTR